MEVHDIHNKPKIFYWPLRKLYLNFMSWNQYVIDKINIHICRLKTRNKNAFCHEKYY